MFLRNDKRAKFEGQLKKLHKQMVAFLLPDGSEKLVHRQTQR